MRMEASVTKSEWFTVRQLAERWNISTDTVKRRIKDGKLLALRLGATHRIHKSAVQVFEAKAMPARGPVITPEEDELGIYSSSGK